MGLPSSPREVAVEMLSRLFSVAPTERGREGSSFSLPEFQREAVDRVRRVLQRRGGAVLADSVGLGKTYVALALIEETVRAGGDALVIVPAATRGMWRAQLRRLDGIGGGWRLFSHTQLARGVRVPPSAAESPGRLIVVDEAHRFRNPRTLRYGALAALVGADSRVLLITATPVNNRAADLLHLLRLFARDDAFRDVGVPSLSGAFRAGAFRAGAAVGAPRGPAGRFRRAGMDEARVTAVVRSAVVRRTRAMIAAGFEVSEEAPELRFPERGPPHIVRFEDPALPALVTGIARLELPAYHLDPAAPGAAALLRLGLLKRLDSSPAAFRSTVARLAQVTRAAIDAARSGRVLSPTLGGAAGRSGDLDPLQLTMVELVASAAPPALDLEALTTALRRDLDRLHSLGRRRGGPGESDAPGDNGRHGAQGGKLDALSRLLDDLAGEKVLLFTEYRDTAESLWRALVGRGRVGRVDGGGAWLGARRAGRRAVVERFAPRANGRPPPPNREGVDVLIATDVLAEGLNLQDARHVVSYDLPWNPVRLLQRIGRVDRLGSMHAQVEVHLFVPAAGLEPLLGLVRRLRTKLGDIAEVVGAEHADDLLDSLAGRPEVRGTLRAGDAESVIETALVGHGDAVETLRTLWLQARGAPDSGRDGANATENRTYRATLRVPAQHAAAALRWILLIETSGDPEILEMDAAGALRVPGPATVAALEFALSSSERDGGDPGSPPLEAVREHFEVAATLAATPPPLSSSDPGARLARRIRHGLGRLGAAATPAQIARADSLLQQLAMPLSPAREAAARALLEAAEGECVTALINEVESALAQETGLVQSGAPGAGNRRSGPTAREATARVPVALRILVATRCPRG